MNLRNSKKAALSLAFISALGASAGCATEADLAEAESSAQEVAQSADEITSVTHSAIRRQSIGNCWIYAVLGWVESVHMRTPGKKDPNLSESYLTYWHWFDEITGGQVRGSTLQTGGGFETATELMANYGLMREGDFVFNERRDEASARQAKALAAIQASLSTGALKDSAARYNKATVRAELDKAFGLTSTAKKRLDAVFGKGAERTLRGASPALLVAQKIISPTVFPVTTVNAMGKEIPANLADLFPDTGKYAYEEAYYDPSNAAYEKRFWRRVKSALHAHSPVVVSWFVDFNALTSNAHFSKKALDAKGVGRQGGHMTVAHDYQAVLADGTRYEAGQDVKDPAILKALLRDDTKLEFLRVKNSWGAVRPDRWADAAIPGYHDLDIDYIRGPLKRCEEDAQGNTDPKQCDDTTPGLESVYLPKGF